MFFHLHYISVHQRLSAVKNLNVSKTYQNR